MTKNNDNQTAPAPEHIIHTDAWLSPPSPHDVKRVKEPLSVADPTSRRRGHLPRQEVDWASGGGRRGRYVNEEKV